MSGRGSGACLHGLAWSQVVVGWGFQAIARPSDFYQVKMGNPKRREFEYEWQNRFRISR